MLLIFKVLLYPLAQMDGDTKFVSRILEDHFMKLSTMAIEHGRLGIQFGRWLVDHKFARPFVNVEAMVAEVDGQRSQAVGDAVAGLVLPFAEDAAGVAAKGYDVAQDLELLERFVDADIVPLSMALDCCRESAETCVGSQRRWLAGIEQWYQCLTCSHHNHFDACFCWL